MYGEPVCASPNGIYIIFRRRNLFLHKMAEEAHHHDNAHIHLHERAMTFTIMKVTPFRLIPVKHVDVIKGIEAILKNME
jgi:hypothetical protein